MFNPVEEYIVVQDTIPLHRFHQLRDKYVVQPPYQRKNVWPLKKKQALLDSIFRRYYIPRIVIREVRIDDQNSKYEIVDGQQRIRTVQEFFANELKLPGSLESLDPSLSGKRYEELPVAVREYFYDLTYTADVIKNIVDRFNPSHQKVASDAFWRLQQGVALNMMEIAHGRLSSLVRNFLVKYADDISFDYDSYDTVENNPQKHHFFSLFKGNNNRMQHLTLLARFLLLEVNDGPTDLREDAITALIDSWERSDGIGNDSYEASTQAKTVLEVLNKLVKIFVSDPMVADGSPLQEFDHDYFVISAFLLARHIKKYYAFNDSAEQLFHDFIIDFHLRFDRMDDEDVDIYHFRDSRQMDKASVEARDRVIRQNFFDYARDNNIEILPLDKTRAFDEAARIAIYRHDKGLCQKCIEEGKSEDESRVAWREWEAHHVVRFADAGPTEIFNGQVLCTYHNRSLG